MSVAVSIKRLEGKKVAASAVAIIATIVLSGEFLIRLYFTLHLLPSPVGDSVLFLEPIYNYCHNDQLVSHLWPMDPSGKDRFDWHGPLPAMLYHFLAPRCTLGTVFALRIVLFLTIPISLALFSWKRMMPMAVFFAVSIFCLALYEKLQFRPEGIAMIFMVLSYCAMRLDWAMCEGALGACAILCAPTSGCLYAITRVAVGGVPDVRYVGVALAGAAGVAFAIAAFYPFPVHDLLAGLRANAQYTANRADGDIFTYYIKSDFLPLFGLSLVTILCAVTAQKPIYLFVLPFIWYFGLRVPTTNYNLMPVIAATFLLGYPTMQRGWVYISIFSLLLPSLGGLAQLSLRDFISEARYPQSFVRSKEIINRLIEHKKNIVAAPAFSVFTNPELTAVAGKDPQNSAGHSSGSVIIVADNGSQGKCPSGTSTKDEPSNLFVFKSSSSWAVRLCYTQ